MRKKLKDYMSKFINFIKSDSWQSWIFCIILIFVIVKFLIFPTLSFILKTSQPLVIIESSSMHHDGGIINIFKLESSFENWWKQVGKWYENNNITKIKAKKFPFRTGMEIGDLVILSGKEKIKVGDVIVFDAGRGKPIIHRVVKIKRKGNKTIYSTKGDNNPTQLTIEKEIKEKQIIGKAIARVPYVGLPKVIIVKILGI